MSEDQAKPTFFVSSGSLFAKNKESVNVEETTGNHQVTVEGDSTYVFSKGFIRIEYPGLVKNTSKAIESLGGIHSIETAVSDPRSNLELRFHPENKYSKPCIAKKVFNPGILLRCRPRQASDETEEKIDYEVVGATSTNFKFTRLCDFQYLPLVSTEKSEDAVEYVYDKIFPQKLPDLEWFTSQQNSEQARFHCPMAFARFDASNNKLYLNAGEKFNLNTNSIKPELLTQQNYKGERLSIKNISIFVDLSDPNIEIPCQPLAYTMKVLHAKRLDEKYVIIKKLFQERPIWTKVAIQYKTGFNTDTTKIVLPALAYFCRSGPWRMAWIRFEYNPMKDYKSRIYQTLDYRIRTSEGMDIKIDAKRNTANRKFIQELQSCKDGGRNIEERVFVIRPGYIPPARQMFYQYCDILIPEIQEMIQRLPKLPVSTKYDTKNGWLPTNFTEHCREVVNKCVLDQLKVEMQNDNLMLQQQQADQSEDGEQSQEEFDSATYCSKMLSNIKSGIYKSVNLQFRAKVEPRDVSTATIVDTINLTEDTMDMDQFVAMAIPERMEENSDDENLSESSELDIDMETVEEINRMVGNTKNV